jgi:DNA repair exonuclease SbcCD nuclease subunit
LTRKILHAADIHLDSPLQKLGSYEGAPADQIRRASRHALENLVRLAIDEAVDLVVIAGDLYDGDWPDQNTGLFFVAQASKLVDAGIPLVVIRGNHDAANRMTSSLPLPKNPDGSEIMMRADRVDLRSFESLGIAVHGRSFQNRVESENLAATYPAPIGGMFNVGLLHTGLTGIEGHDPYAPCTPAELADKRYDYWALGHIHMRGNHAIEGAAPVVFSGNLQGRHIRECGPKGCVIVDIDQRNRCQMRFHELDVVRWQLCQLDVSKISYSEEVFDLFQQWLNEHLPDAGHRLLVVRVELVGETELHHLLRRNQKRMMSSLQSIAVSHGQDQVWLEQLRVRCRGPVETQADVDLEGPLASLATVLDELKRQDDLSRLIKDELQSLNKKLPVELAGEDPALPLDDPEWMTDLLESAASEVLARLQQTESEK